MKDSSEIYLDEPQNYMTLAIISTILGCCSFLCIGFITGIIAIYFASQVKPKYNENDFEAAEKNSKNARIFSFISIGLFFFGMLYSLYIYIFNPEIFEQQQELIRQLMEQYQ